MKLITRDDLPSWFELLFKDRGLLLQGDNRLS